MAASSSFFFLLDFRFMKRDWLNDVSKTKQLHIFPPTNR